VVGACTAPTWPPWPLRQMRSDANAAALGIVAVARSRTAGAYGGAGIRYQVRMVLLVSDSTGCTAHTCCLLLHSTICIQLCTSVTAIVWLELAPVTYWFCCAMQWLLTAAGSHCEYRLVLLLLLLISSRGCGYWGSCVIATRRQHLKRR
jgi:hypothetical protein